MITLGHNSSAIFYDGVNKPIGYEQERLDEKKGSSSFPKDAIEEILKNVDDDTAFAGAYLLISHWFDDFDLTNESNRKYYDKAYIETLVADYGMKLITLSKDFTHHDAHAYSASGFFEHHVSEQQISNYVTDNRVDVLVVDGFGNNQEVLSLYSLQKSSDPLKSHDRVFGYNNSLGLMYQFATEYCGMKPNQDEYKFLGYESHISEIVGQKNIESLKKIAVTATNNYVARVPIFREFEQIKSDDTIDLKDLASAKTHWFSIFDEFMGFLEIDDITVFEKRVVIGFVLQTMLEEIVVGFLKNTKSTNICLAGGTFYNVKLNNRILNQVSGLVSVMPLAGDQGAAIGMYEKYVGYFNYSDLTFGVRKLEKRQTSVENVHFVESESEMVDLISELLEKDQIVNVLNGDMEFGPRALCNTSTLAKPTTKNVDYINRLNMRNTVMPMAPVVLDTNVEKLFGKRSGYDRIVGSYKYMIITLDYDTENLGYYEDIRGVMHKYPNENRYSGRPQVVSDGYMKEVLSRSKERCLINTSFNTHGHPILFSTEQAIRDFWQQKTRDNGFRAHLIINTN